MENHHPLTVVVGATPNPHRYAFKAAHMLKAYGHPIIPLGIRKGELAGEPIQDLRQQPELPHVDTLTLYIGPKHLTPWIDYLLSLRPRRIIFNPGTAHPVFQERARAQGILVEEACTLVMLQLGEYGK